MPNKIIRKTPRQDNPAVDYSLSANPSKKSRIEYPASSSPAKLKSDKSTELRDATYLGLMQDIEKAPIPSPNAVEDTRVFDSPQKQTFELCHDYAERTVGTSIQLQPASPLEAIRFFEQRSEMAHYTWLDRMGETHRKVDFSPLIQAITNLAKEETALNLGKAVVATHEVFAVPLTEQERQPLHPENVLPDSLLILTDEQGAIHPLFEQHIFPADDKKILRACFAVGQSESPSNDSRACTFAIYLQINDKAPPEVLETFRELCQEFDGNDFILNHSWVEDASLT